jgi:hypothetical protein
MRKTGIFQSDGQIHQTTPAAPASLCDLAQKLRAARAESGAAGQEGRN